MAEAVLSNQLLIRLLPRFNLNMGFGDLTIEQVCENAGINTDFFLEITNAYLVDEYPSQIDLSLYSVGLIADYLRNTHVYYTEIAVPKLEKLIEALFLDKNLSKKHKELVTDFFNDYKKEFLDHIEKEELQVLPYVVEIEKQYHNQTPDDAFLNRLKGYSIKEFAREHDRLENSLTNLSKLIIKYLPPLQNRDISYQLLNDLSSLVRDLIDHANMEDKIMVPRVEEMEHVLLKKRNRK